MAGAATVILTLLLLIFLPASATRRLFETWSLWHCRPLPFRHLISCISAIVLAALIWQGLIGTRDPLANPLPLAVWAVWWIVLVFLQGFLCDHWKYINPWTGPTAGLAWLTGLRPPFRYPRWFGHWPGVVLLLAFACILMVDPAPADPSRLARYVGIYWYLTLLGLVLFGPVWLIRAEALTIMMRTYRQVAIIGCKNGRLALGLSGWQMTHRPIPKPGLAVFMLVLLGCGSFDGLNETFWWMGQLGINPLEFPGRSAVVVPNFVGMLLANILLIASFTACLWLGHLLIRKGTGLLNAFCLYAPTLLPIALAYHLAHYLPSFLVEGQYVLKLVNEFLGLNDVYVTTGFFSRPDAVKAIWLTQAGAVVVGHVIAILLAHLLALRSHSTHSKALIVQLPLAVFMVFYTVFGLWLLASPRG
ncbi:hypothetical protein [Roseovarius sp. EL26]|uniref:hypothetical protein n=1 Tax=Roseovarius sp. EL26 TaxID=2126672 RepID=UPI0020B155E9|nr:hypothetical protein [Roseovarius sp. EL26]